MATVFLLGFASKEKSILKSTAILCIARPTHASGTLNAQNEKFILKSTAIL